MFDRIDSWLLSHTDAAAGWLEAAAGASQWAVARQLLLASLTMFVAQALSAITMAPDTLPPPALDRLVDLIWLAVIMAVAVRFCWYQVERQSRSRQGAQTALIAESLPRGIQLIAIAMMSIPLAAKAPLILAGFVAFQAHFYFKACTPRPPVHRGRLARIPG